MENGINWLYPKSILSNVWQVGLRVGSGIRFDSIWIYWIYHVYMDTAISIKVVPRAKRKSRIRARKAAGNR